MPLTDLEVRRAAPREKTYRISDGRGMYLEITPAGGKYWLRIPVNVTADSGAT